ncbi:MAG: ABC transporter ATP-binding protein [Ruminococcaceae bacterium]|nr:ABC transporter ATP-binding protein [Oscillospiraceae bacterium]
MAITVSGVSGGYGKKTVLSDFSASFEKGQITCVIGPNGCGKSTLLKTVIGSIKPFSGDILVDGKRVSKPCERSKRIAFLAQGKSISDMTVFETVLHGRFPHLSFPRVYCEKDREKAFLCLERLGLSEFCDQPVSTLSGGMRQKVYIAMALCQDTEYILLDEPTTYLDISNAFELFDIIKSLAESGKGIIMVLHDLVTALQFSDSVLVMNGGKNVFFGSPDEVVASGVIKDVFGVGITKHDGAYFYERNTKNG